MMISWKLKLLVLLASLSIVFNPELARSLGGYFVVPLLTMAWSIWHLFTGPLNSLEQGVSTKYAFAPEGYNDEDPLRGLIPKFALTDPKAPIAYQQPWREPTESN